MQQGLDVHPVAPRSPGGHRFTAGPGCCAPLTRPVASPPPGPRSHRSLGGSCCLTALPPRPWTPRPLLGFMASWAAEQRRGLYRVSSLFLRPSHAHLERASTLSPCPARPSRPTCDSSQHGPAPTQATGPSDRASWVPERAADILEVPAQGPEQSGDHLLRNSRQQESCPGVLGQRRTLCSCQLPAWSPAAVGFPLVVSPLLPARAWSRQLFSAMPTTPPKSLPPSTAEGAPTRGAHSVTTGWPSLPRAGSWRVWENVFLKDNYWNPERVLEENYQYFCAREHL